MKQFSFDNFHLTIFVIISSLLMLTFIATPVQAAPSCNSITLNVSPNPVNAGGSTNFSISGEASLYQNNSFTGGVNSCSGAWFDPWNSKTCTTTNAGTYTWTHTWRYCEGSFENCSPTCSASKTFTVSSPSPPCDTTYKNDRFHACYFNGTNPESGSILSQQDEGALTSPVSSATAFNYDWGGGVVGSSGKTDQVSAIWRGKINFAAGTYVFHVRSDDGVTLDVEGYGRIIDKWQDQAPTTYDSASINLPAGYRNVAVRWYENGGGAFAKLWWDYTSSNPEPYGTLDAADCDSFRGWACDESNNNQPIDVHFYADGNRFVGATTANQFRQDLVNAGVCGSTGGHGFTFSTPDSLRDGNNHSITAHGINIPPGPNRQLPNSPKTINCPAVRPNPTNEPGPPTSCGRGLTRATGLVSTLNVTTDTKFNSRGGCIVDPKAYFVEQKIPTYESLKSRYFTQTKESSTVKKATHNGDTGEGGLSNYLNTGKNLIFINGNLGMNNNLTGTNTAVVFVEGSLQMTNANFTYGNNTSGIVFVVKGDVFINRNVTQFDGVIITNGTIYTAASPGTTCTASSQETSALTINGSLVSLDKNKPVKFCRKLRNNAQPAEVINLKPKYLVILKDLFSDTVQRWSELP